MANYNTAASSLLDNAGQVSSEAFTYLAVACIILAVLVVFLLFNAIKNAGKGKKDKKKPDNKKVIASGKLSGSQKKQLRNPKKVQDRIPYIATFKNGTFELRTNSKKRRFGKIYTLDDADFTSKSEIEQENILNSFAQMLNLLIPEAMLQISVINRSEDEQTVEEKLFLKPVGDSLNKYRDEFNDKILRQKLTEGNNSIVQEKYAIITIEAVSPAEAEKMFNKMSNDFNSSLLSITAMGMHPIDRDKFLSVLYDIYNPNAALRYGQKKLIDGTTVIVEDLAWLASQGLTTKDAIAPQSLEFKTNEIILGGETHCKVYYLKDQDNKIMPDVIREICAIPCNLVTSVHFQQERTDKALKMLRRSLTNINSDVIEEQKNAAKQGYSGDLISTELLTTQELARQTLESVMVDNQNIFYTTLVVAIFGKDKADLKYNEDQLITAGKKYGCTLKPLTYMQEQGFNSALPFGDLQIEMDKLQTTSSATAFHPFSCVDIMHPRGIWYGQNVVSGNVCMVDRNEGLNYNSIIMGQSGSGKSMTAKGELSQALMKYSNDTFYVVDPEQEYVRLAKGFDGEVVRIAPDTKNYINPLDMDLNYGDDINDSIAMKVDFIESIVETMVGEDYSLPPDCKSLIDRCGRNIYKPYIKHMETLKETGQTIDFNAMPTLEDLYNELVKQPEPSANQLAMYIEPYCIGTKNIFSHKTNIDSFSRFVVFDIKDVGSGNMKELGIQVCLNYIWNKAISNSITARKLRDKVLTKSQINAKHLTGTSKTWVYIDEFHVLTRTDITVAFLVNIWKRARKWQTNLTAITQNLSDFMRTIDTQAILKNSMVVIMMNLTPLDRQDATDIYNLSTSQLTHVSQSRPGTALFCWGEKTVIELDCTVPTDTELFELIRTSVTMVGTKAVRVGEQREDAPVRKEQPVDII